MYKSLETHYTNIDKEFDLLNITDLDKKEERTRIRENIMKELKQSCTEIIEEINDPTNENYQEAKSFLECLQYGYDICLIIELRNLPKLRFFLNEMVCNIGEMDNSIIKS